jgi:hypothetical protein
LFSRFSGFVDQIFFQCAGGNPVNASRSTAASRSIVSTFADCRLSMPAMTSSWSRTISAFGWAKMARIAVATISAEPLGTWPAGCDAWDVATVYVVGWRNGDARVPQEEADITSWRHFKCPTC